MRHILLLTGCLIGATFAVAQTPATNYRATPRKINDLVHTKLDVRFDYTKRYLYGKEWVTLKPHGYPTDSLRLDAKGMDIKRVALLNGEQQQALKFDYDQTNLRVNLGKTVAPGTTYTLYIEYTAKPDELKLKGSEAIGGAKGLYFINPDSAVAGKPVQIWTQGESESNSTWFPTIDKPNQKTTSEISLTVPSKYVTLSNGALVSQKPAGAGLRTDTWQMDLPHAPYLFMMAVGDFKIHKETWRGKEVSYYLEPQYAGQAQAIFGKTPAMLEFFSQRLGVEYPWNKYAQVVVRDYVAGAMENTTASLFGPHAQGTAREILDWDYTLVEREVAHELFHHWFGDYVTTESWSNLTVNESFANFSEVLWAEHAYGPDAGAAQADRSLRNYLRTPGSHDKHLARYQYADKEDMFDNVTYQKGGSILNMLRTYLGNDVFFAGLRRYLTQNAFGVGEPHQLRLALEEASGQDLNWFFNQWYYRAGHPVVTIDYSWDAAQKTQAVTVKQTQPGDPFQLPFAIDYYVNGQPQRQRVTMTEATQTFRMPLASKPDLVNVDAEKTLVWQKQDHKPLPDFAYQYRHAPHYLDRREALSAAKTQLATPQAQQILVASLTDASPALREMAVELLDLQNPALRTAAAPILARLAAIDSALPVRAAALTALGTLKEKRYSKLFEQALESKSYRVQGAALQGLLQLNARQALARTTAFEADNKGALTVAMVSVYGRAGSPAQWPLVLAKYDAADPNGRFGMLPGVAEFLGRLNDPAALTEGITRIKDLTVRYKPYVDANRLIGLLRQVQQQHTTRPTAAHTTTLVDQAVAEIQAAK
ncbi:HEAT repeat domain-containing protein [Hymenobacter sp. BT186]|uniref:Aminopeptidase N n=1 Tax=Hymenobacter telluris TaxID=2816474 RepID=A0A939EVQ5_9BACT|nr:M1 family aminopeptidase [Hymenobacter telluris]MBO0358097.1 HEAT repeat domain-containing protein [Hymenobacter telluris]MBW3374124.1 HEAT repeat domain-containing protein [Hymenobacter norwichensis]